MRLRVEEIIRWAKLQHQRYGVWPNRKSGVIQDASFHLTWCAVDLALQRGGRKLPGGSSLAKLYRGLAEIRAIEQPESLNDRARFLRNLIAL